MFTHLFRQSDGQLKPFVHHGVIVIAVATAAYFVYAGWTGGDRPQQTTLMCSTDGCSYQRTRSLQLGETLPLVCPKCGKRSVVPAFRCSKCGTLNVWNEDRGLAPPTECRKCGHEAYHERPTERGEVR